MQAYRGTGGYFKKKLEYIYLLIACFIKQELDNLETKPTELKSATMKPKNHQQNPVVKLEFL